MTYTYRSLFDLNQYFHESTPSPFRRLYYPSRCPVSNNSTMRVAFSLDLGRRASWFNHIRVIVWALVLMSSLSLVMYDHLPTWRTPTTGDVKVHDLTLWIGWTNVAMASCLYVSLHLFWIYRTIALTMLTGLACTLYCTKPVPRLCLSSLHHSSSRLLGLYLNIVQTNWELTMGALPAMLGPCTGSV